MSTMTTEAKATTAEVVVVFNNGVVSINSEEGLIIATSRGEVIRDWVAEEFSKTEIFWLSDDKAIQNFTKAAKALAKIGRTVQSACWLLRWWEVDGNFYPAKYPADVLA